MWLTWLTAHKSTVMYLTFSSQPSTLRELPCHYSPYKSFTRAMQHTAIGRIRIVYGESEVHRRASASNLRSMRYRRQWKQYDGLSTVFSSKTIFFCLFWFLKGWMKIIILQVKRFVLTKYSQTAIATYIHSAHKWYDSADIYCSFAALFAFQLSLVLQQ